MDQSQGAESPFPEPITASIDVRGLCARRRSSKIRGAMAERAILVKGEDGWRVARESGFVTELDLQEAVAAHPEVLPAEDVGLDTLVTLGTEIAAAEGFIDMLAADRQGRLAIIEFKKGPENPDVRRVVAQLLDYGSALWQMSLEELERRCRVADNLVNHMAGVLGADDFDPEVFTSGLQGTLANGDFVYFYVARVLDSRTRRVLTYLGDGVRLPFIAVEAERFVGGETTVVAPRAAFVPGWMIASGGATRTRPSAQPASETLSSAPRPVKELAALLDELAEERSWHRREEANFIYSLDGGFPRLYFNPDGGLIEFRLNRFARVVSSEDAAELHRRLEEIEERPLGEKWPGLTDPQHTLRNWPRIRDQALIPYVERQQVTAPST